MKYLWNKFCLLSRFKQIGIVVLGVHCATILALSWNPFWSKKPHPSQPIAIRTITLSRTNTPSLTSNSTTPKKRTNTPLIKTQPPNTSKSSKTIATPKQTKKPPSTTRLASTEEALLQQLSNSLDALSKPAESADTKFAVSIPSAVETTTIPYSQSYRTAFTMILQNNLDLPEFGTVTAKIEINPEGKVTALEILDARSQKNSEFLKKRLQELTFPCFNEFGLSEKYLHFTVTFRNVETY